MSIPMAAAIGFVIAMLVAILLTATAGRGKSEKSVIRAAGGPLTLFGGATVYLFVIFPTFAGPGITLGSLLILVVAVVLPGVAAGGVRGMMSRLSDQRGTLRDAVGGVIAFALIAGQLSIAGAVMSLFGGVSRVIATGAFGIACAGYLLGSGRVGSIRTSRYAVLGAVIAVLVLVVGFVVGSPATITSPLVPFDALSVGTIVAVLLAVGALGCFDPNLRAALTCPQRPGRTLVIGSIVVAGSVLALGIGGILFFGGVLEAPNLEIMTVFAVLPAIGVLVMMLVFTFMLASNVDSLLSAGAQTLTRSDDPAGARSTTMILALIAIVAAVLIPNPTLFLVVAALVAAASIGALAPAWGASAPRNPWPSFIAGAIAGIIVGLVLGADEVVRVTGATAVVLVVAAVVAALTTMAVGGRGAALSDADTPETVDQAV